MAILIPIIFCILLGVMSIMLFMGKGSWMIAGYNTASKKEKEMYDEKKLCRTVGVILMTASITTGLMIFYHSNVFVLNCVVIQILVTIGGIIYANTACKKK